MAFVYAYFFSDFLRFDISLLLLTVTMRGVSNKHCLLSLFSFLHEQRQRSAFHYIDNKTPLYIRNFKPLSILYGCTAWFMSDLVGHPEGRLSLKEAHLVYVLLGSIMLTCPCNYAP